MAFKLVLVDNLVVVVFGGVDEFFTDDFTITFTVHPTRWTMFRNIVHPTRWTMCRNMPTPLGGQLYVTLST